jgi:hypothetical protein
MGSKKGWNSFRRKKERIILIRNGPTVNFSILLAGFKKNICSS